LIINSPVGRFPFTITSVRRRGSVLVVDGEMGNWPTSVEVRPSDIPAVLMRLRPILLPALGAAGVAVLALSRARRA
jgi:hypothetical protein